MAAYYNEIDPYAAEWLRNLIAAGHIAPGDVDTRSITEVQPDDLRPYTQCHFFAGIGGWSRALRLAEWSDDRSVWTGSCPCQPFSAAGKRKAGTDARHLWPVWFRLIAECQPDRVFGEQVEGAVGLGWLDRVFADLEGKDYACGAAVLGAHSVRAPHIRQRLYWLADSGSERFDGQPIHLQQRGSFQDRVEAAGRGAARGLAHTDGGLAGDGDLQRCGQHGQQPQDGGAGRMGHTEREQRGSRRLPGHGSTGAAHDGHAPEESPGAGVPRRVEHTSSDRREQWRPESGGRCTVGGRGESFWNADWLPCTDGKARRVEPGTFPLAHGVSGRVGRLRAYGNAIVPQVAAEFVRTAA